MRHVIPAITSSSNVKSRIELSLVWMLRIQKWRAGPSSPRSRVPLAVRKWLPAQMLGVCLVSRAMNLHFVFIFESSFRLSLWFMLWNAVH